MRGAIQILYIIIIICNQVSGSSDIIVSKLYYKVNRIVLFAKEDYSIINHSLQII